MKADTKTLFDLERRFWQSMVEQDTQTALDMLCEPAVMVSSHGAMQFDHAQYRQMAEQGSMVLRSFDLDEMKALFPNDDTAILTYRVRQKLAERKGGRPVEQQMLDTSVWTRQPGGDWQCAMHTETPAQAPGG